MIDWITQFYFSIACPFHSHYFQFVSDLVSTLPSLSRKSVLLFPSQFNRTLFSFSIHALVMSLWIFIFDRSPFCSNTLFHSIFFSAILGFVFIFNYILTKARNTRYRYTVYYFICFIENLICATLFKFYSSTDAIYSEFFPLLLALSIIPFLLGIICMCIYYTAFHPNVMARKDIQRQTMSTNSSST